MQSKRRQLFAVSAIALAVAGVGSCSFMGMSFDIPQEAQVMTLTSEQLRCFEASSELTQPLDVDGVLRLSVWNIYKGALPGWQEELDSLTAKSDLVLLQEASLHEDFRHYLDSKQWQVAMANAFSLFDQSAGVLNLSRVEALQSCAYLTTEPWLRLPKSALYAEFPLSTGEVLAVVNLHGINFTLGTEIYAEQLARLAQALSEHEGPIIVAGDFNTWRKGRQKIVEAFAEKLGMQHAQFGDDYRTRVLGRPLDHLFYRGLTLENAEAPETDASDHNPLWAQFRLG
ncbi:endonuclease/exonuclease/phosphatase family protein [Thaumasiovibrio subtropicus]|uniref:endonuclease/exonuclease/phosphatase family protein n=1 Tax=Thaumasiovibrio subtropicus TaxID=1891207 RepID=UPI000B363213|nr:endonuclease/exonuclease/phosphatase family protein [Thaumasiovibrio subtropicus]